MKAQITNSEFTPSDSLNITSNNQRFILDYPQPNLKNQFNNNTFNYKTLPTEIPGLEIKVLDSHGKVRHQKIDHHKLQEKLLSRMKPFLNNDKIDYDAKLMGVLLEYERIVDQIYQKGFHVKLPENFNSNPQNFNDYYEYAIPKNSQTDDYLEMLISYTTTPMREPSPIFTPAESKSPEIENAEEPLQEKKENEQDENELEIQNEDFQENHQGQIQQIEQVEEKTIKQQEKKIRQPRKKTQKQPSREINLNPEDDKPMLIKKDINIKLNQSQINEENSEEQIIQQRQKERDRLMQIEIQKAREERRREIERLENELRQKKGNNQEFVYQKENDNSEQKFLEEQARKKKLDQIETDQSEKLSSRPINSKRNPKKLQQEDERNPPSSPNSIKLALINNNNQQIQQPIHSQRKLKATKKEIIKQSQSDLSQPEDQFIQTNRTNSTHQQEQNIQINLSNSSIKPVDISNQASFRGDPQKNPLESKKNQTAKELQNITKGVNKKQSQTQKDEKIKNQRILTDETQNNQSIKQDQLSNKQDQSSIKQDQSQIKQDQSSIRQDQSSIKQDESSIKQDQTQLDIDIQKTQKTNESIINQEILEQTEEQKEEGVLDEIHEQISRLKTNFDEKYKRWYADVLLASENVFEVDINEWKISQYDRTQIVMPNIELGEDRVAFYEMVCWKEEIQQVIPRLRELNPQAQPDNLEETPSPSQKKKKEKKKNEES